MTLIGPVWKYEYCPLRWKHEGDGRTPGGGVIGVCHQTWMMLMKGKVPSREDEDLVQTCQVVQDPYGGLRMRDGKEGSQEEWAGSGLRAKHLSLDPSTYIQ